LGEKKKEKRTKTRTTEVTGGQKGKEPKGWGNSLKKEYTGRERRGTQGREEKKGDRKVEEKTIKVERHA